MDEILKLLGGGNKDEPSDQQDYQQDSPNRSLPGGGGVWEFEMPAGGVEELKQNTNVYNVPPPRNDGANSYDMKYYEEHSSGLEDSGYEQEVAFAIPGGVPQSDLDVQESTIEGYMRSLNWPFEKMDQGLWALKYEGGAKDYEMFVEMNAQNVRIVTPVLERVRDVCREKVWHHLLRLNYVTDQITFGINKRDEIFMVTEILMKYISYDDFKRAITYISTMVDEVYPELLFLAQKPSAVSSFLQD